MPEQFLHGVEVVEIDNGLRPIRTLRSSVLFFVGTAPEADADVFPLDTPVLVEGPGKAAALGATGTLRDCFDAAYAQGAGLGLYVRVAEDADEATQLANVVGDAALQTGVHAAMSAHGRTGLKPRLLAAPGFTGQRPGDAANPVAAALKGIAESLRAIVFVDGPDTTEAAAITARGDFGSDRVYLVDPGVLVFDTATATNVTRPASAFAAAATARRDAEKGFWWSPSNQEINGIVGTSRPVSFALSDPDTQTNRLNENEVATVVYEGGFRLWGNRSTATDPNWAFLSVRRTADMIYEAIEAAFLWAMDRPFSPQLVNDIQESAAAYLRTLRARGAILGFKVWIDPELNTEANLKAGKLFVNFDIEPPAPLEHLTFQAYRNGTYYEELTGDLIAAA